MKTTNLSFSGLLQLPEHRSSWIVEVYGRDQGVSLLNIYIVVVPRFTAPITAHNTTKEFAKFPNRREVHSLLLNCVNYQDQVVDIIGRITVENDLPSVIREALKGARLISSIQGTVRQLTGLFRGPFLWAAEPKKRKGLKTCIKPRFQCGATSIRSVTERRSIGAMYDIAKLLKTDSFTYHLPKHLIFLIRWYSKAR